MTPRRNENTWVPVTVSRRLLTVVDITAALMGVQRPARKREAPNTMIAAEAAPMTGGGRRSVV